ncbi:MAG: universal stress protein [Actinomycetota bacterium]|jgi:nucleotide-binding universal stress UspA family protein|nr:universal stress protein [Actinomycetota bacterium]
MFEKLIVAVDSSPASDRAVARASDLARISGGTVQLLHVVEHVSAPAGRFAGGFDLEDTGEGEQLLAREIAVLRSSGVPVSAKVVRARVGHVAQAIAEAARSEEADLIVMGSRGRSEIAALMLGSSAFKLLHISNRPVLIVP